MTSWLPGVLGSADLPARVVIRSASGFLTHNGDPLFPGDASFLDALTVFGTYELGRYRDATVTLYEVEPFDLPNLQWSPLRPLMLQSDHALFKLLGYAAQIGTWARQHRFCGQCGHRTVMISGQRAMRCDQCGLTQYPRISPSIIVLITREDELLLARSPRFAPGVYSTLAGFIEPGESAEACVHREVKEEVAVEVGNLQYLGSQNWPYPHSLMLGFHAEYLSGDIRCQPDEIEDARWFSIDALPHLPPRQAISRFLIDTYLARCSGLPEPVLAS